MEVKLSEKLECKRCHHRWLPRIKEVVLCPHCGSPYWYLERINPRRKKVT